VKRNPPLTIGLILLGLIALIAILGPSLAPADPLKTHTGVPINGEYVYPPYPPFTVPGFPLGSDLQGRDLLSRLLHGIRPTMILLTLAAFIRLALGAVIGMAAGWSKGKAGRALEGLISAALVVPTVIVSLAVITAIGIQKGLPAFLIGLCATGWADTARVVSEQTRGLRAKPFIEAARAMGGGSSENVVRHILRHVTPTLAMLLVFEAGATLMAIAVLGFLGYYLGGAFLVEVTDFSQRAISGLPELGQMLSASWQIFKPWATVITGTVIFTAILGFNLVGEGLRRRLSIGALGTRGAFSGALARAGSWVSETLLVPDAQNTQRRRALGAVAAVLLAGLIVFVWKPWQPTTAASGATSTAQGMPVVGDHLWGAERRDPYGSAAVPGASEIPAQILWTLTDESGFSGGPVVDAGGNVYVAAKKGLLYAISSDGEALWASELPAEPVGTPALGPADANGGLGAIYIADQAGGVSAYTLEGGYLWRAESGNKRRASSGPVVGPDGVIYYSAVDRLQAVNRDGTVKWSSAKLPGTGDVTPRLDQDGRIITVQDAVLDTETGKLVDYSMIVPAGEAGINAIYMTGGDGKRYVRLEHSVVQWDMTESGPRQLGMTSWRWQTATVYQPFDSAVMLDGTAALVYGSMFDDLRVVLLQPGDLLLANLHYPMRDPKFAASDSRGMAYICGGGREGFVECIGVRAGDYTEPAWRMAFEREAAEAATFAGAALTPGRLYVATGDGWLFAAGE
jgi:ABC-type dipeptide/oligopeptide/nickel transport system permease subunit